MVVPPAPPAVPSAWRFALAGVYALVGLVLAAVLVGVLVRGFMADLQRLPGDGGQVTLDEGRYSIFVEYPIGPDGYLPEGPGQIDVRMSDVSSGDPVATRPPAGSRTFSTPRRHAHAVAVADVPAGGAYLVEPDPPDPRATALVVVPAVVPVVVRGLVGLGVIGIVTLTAAIVSLVRTARRRERAKQDLTLTAGRHAG